LGQAVLSLVHPEERERYLALHKEASEGRTGTAEFRVIGLKGGMRWLESNSVPLRSQTGEITAVLSVTRDITESKEAEEALRRSEQALRRALEERERIAQNLHDGIMQSIFAIGLGLERCQRLIIKDPGEASKQLSSSLFDLKLVNAELRSHILGLEPQLTDGRGLEAELHAVLSNLATGPVQFTLELDHRALDLLRAEQAVQVLYIVREATSNTIRHSQGIHGRIALEAHHHVIRLIVEDDGIGFDATLPHEHGCGLGNMAARARRLGARFDVCSSPAQGTRILIEITVPPHHEIG
jgi:signal transduction histidine kinase